MTRVLNTRPAPNGSELSDQLAEHGIVSVNYPVIVNQAISASSHDLNKQLTDPHCAWIFISIPAVLFFNDYLSQSGVQQFSPKGQVFAVGKSTAQALQSTHAGIEVSTPAQSNSEFLVAMPELLKFQKAVLVKGVGGRGLIQQTLRSKGTIFTDFDIMGNVAKIINFGASAYNSGFVLFLTFNYPPSFK